MALIFPMPYRLPMEWAPGYSHWNAEPAFNAEDIAMQIAPRWEPSAPGSTLAEVERLVSDTLFGDWVIQIEYCDPTTSHSNSWIRWGTAFFAVRDPSEIVDAIVMCRKAHPDRQIRLHTEKLRPQTRFVYYLDQPAKAEPRLRLVKSGSQPKPDESASRSSVWRVAAVVGGLAAALVLFEEVVLLG